MKTLTFVQIADSRFDADPVKALKERTKELKERLKSLKGVRVECEEERRIDWPDNYQWRIRFWVQKDGRKVTWNDIFHQVNEVKAVPYTFCYRNPF